MQPDHQLEGTGQRSSSKASGLKLGTPEQSDRVFKAAVGHEKGSLRAGVSGGKGLERCGIR